METLFDVVSLTVAITVTVVLMLLMCAGFAKLLVYVGKKLN